MSSSFSNFTYHSSPAKTKRIQTHKTEPFSLLQQNRSYRKINKEWSINHEELKIGKVLRQARQYSIHEGQWHGDVYIYKLNLSSMSSQRSTRSSIGGSSSSSSFSTSSPSGNTSVSSTPTWSARSSQASAVQSSFSSDVFSFDNLDKYCLEENNNNDDDVFISMQPQQQQQQPAANNNNNQKAIRKFSKCSTDSAYSSISSLDQCLSPICSPDLPNRLPNQQQQLDDFVDNNNNEKQVVRTTSDRQRKVAQKLQETGKFWNDLANLCSVAHENFVLFMGACPDTDNLSIVMDKCNGPTLYQCLHQPNATERKRYQSRFMEEYGHRSYNEFDIASKRWRETPIVVIDMIKQYCRQNQLSTKQSTNNYNDNNVHDKPNNLIVYNGDQRNNVNSISKTNHIKSSRELLSDMDIHLGLRDRIDLDYFILNKCHQFIDGRESAKDLIIYSNYTIRLAVCLLADEMVRQNRIPDQDSIFYLTYGEIQRLIDNSEPTIVAQAQRRRRFIKKLDSWKFNEIISGHDFLPRHLNVDNDEAKQEKERLKLIPRISGTPACSGQVSGRVCVVNGYSELNRVKSGDILVTYSTDIAFSPVFPITGGIVTEIGGLISHGAVIAREYGIPTLIGIQNACSILKDGEQVILDANLGHLLRLDYSTHQ